MHEGHRERLRKKLRSGSYLPDHELLELLLTYSIPRKNTNDIAHRLLHAFGSVQGVLAADRNQLMSVRGIGKETALYIELIGRMISHDALREEEGGWYLDREESVNEYARELFGDMDGEAVYLVLLNSLLRVTDCICLGMDSGDCLSDVTAVMRSPWAHHSCAAMLLHNHPDGAEDVSEEDREFASRVSELLSLAGIELIENVVVADGRCRFLMKGLRPD